VYEVNAYALGGMLPEVTFFLDLPATEGIRRKDSQHELDRMELQDVAFHERVVAGYRELARTQSNRIVTIDAMQTIEEIRTTIADTLESLLEDRR
jgi:dTMP kinase